MKALETLAKIMKPLQIKFVLPKLQYIALGAEYSVTNTASHSTGRFVGQVILVVPSPLSSPSPIPPLPFPPPQSPFPSQAESELPCP